MIEIKSALFLPAIDNTLLFHAAKACIVLGSDKNGVMFIGKWSALLTVETV